jgi:hypothetical protein
VDPQVETRELSISSSGGFFRHVRDGGFPIFHKDRKLGEGVFVVVNFGFVTSGCF